MILEFDCEPAWGSLAAASHDRSDAGSEASCSVTHAELEVQRRNKLRIVIVRGFGWGIAHAAVTRRPPIPPDTMVHRTGGYAYDIGSLGFVFHSRTILCRSVPNP
jgi:hypothetical protein